MIELAEVIAEHALDNNAENWFRLPWRNGWNAVELAATATVDASDSWLLDVCACVPRPTSDDIYWAAQDRLSSTITPSRMMRAGLRCLQALLAKSDGGGEVYNAILRTPFANVYPESVAHLVLEYRCRDSIGVSAGLIGDVNDRLRRAFTTAWKRGLYLASYSLPPAKLAPIKVVK
jgi:hypothetical protein